MIYYHLCYHLSGAPSKDTPEWVRMHQEELGFDRSGIDEKNVNSANQYLKSYKDSRYQKVIEAGEGGTAIVCAYSENGDQRRHFQRRDLPVETGGFPDSRNCKKE